MAATVQSLKKELRDWERSFQAEEGRKPTKQDIGSDASGIAARYKLYSKLKAAAAVAGDSDNTGNDTPEPAPARRPKPSSRRRQAAVGGAEAEAADDPGVPEVNAREAPRASRSSRSSRAARMAYAEESTTVPASDKPPVPSEHHVAPVVKVSKSQRRQGESGRRGLARAAEPAMDTALEAIPADGDATDREQRRRRREARRARAAVAEATEASANAAAQAMAARMIPTSLHDLPMRATLALPSADSGIPSLLSHQASSAMPVAAPLHTTNPAADGASAGFQSYMTRKYKVTAWQAASQQQHEQEQQRHGPLGSVPATKAVPASTVAPRAFAFPVPEAVTTLLTTTARPAVSTSPAAANGVIELEAPNAEGMRRIPVTRRAYESSSTSEAEPEPEPVVPPSQTTQRSMRKAAKAAAAAAAEALPERLEDLIKPVGLAAAATAAVSAAVPVVKEPVPAPAPEPEPEPELAMMAAPTTDLAAAWINADNLGTALGETPPLHVNPVFWHRVPENTVLRCRIMRRRGLIDKAAPLFLLFCQSSDVPILAARRRLTSTVLSYHISTSPDDLAKESRHYVAQLKANFQRTNYILTDARGYNVNAANKGLRESACISYSKTVLPREMTVAIPSLAYAQPVLTDPLPPAGTVYSTEALTGPPRGQYRDILSDFKTHNTAALHFLKNRAPRWNETSQSHCLNFGGRVTQPSIKNFQLIEEAREAYITMQFGRCAQDAFTLDVRWPLSPVQAFAIALSTFDAYDSA